MKKAIGESDMALTEDPIRIDPAVVVERLTDQLQQNILKTLRKRGAVVGVSGGVDSSVVLALCCRAFGPNRVVAVMIPEKESNPNGLDCAIRLATKFQVSYEIEDITPALYGAKSYARRDAAIRKTFPEYNIGCKAKISLPSGQLDKDSLNVFRLTIITPSGEEKTKRLRYDEFSQIVAASNLKQRIRMCMLYYHAEVRNYAVVGTGNKNEHDLGFFVKHGDGASDVMPLVRLFKTQVYQLAEFLGIPDEIRQAVPTTDTYSARQTQEEFFFRLPFETLDQIWNGWEKGLQPEEMASALHLKPTQIQNVINDIDRKIAATHYLRREPLKL